MTIYTANIPQPGDIPAQSQDQILQNFQSVNDSIGTVTKDLVPLSDTTNRGYHNKSTYIAGSDATTGALQGAVYAKDVGAGSTELFWRKNANATPVRMTDGAILNANPGYSFLPGGLLIQFGTATVGANTTVIVTFPRAFSGACYCANLTYHRNSATPFSIYVVPGSFTSTQMTVRGTSNNADVFSFIAIGPG